ncbi:MAG: ABC transporter ATP-binding protein [Planctomycetota bacterium]
MGNLVATSLHKDFGTFRALQDISFSVASGECLVLFGASGAGKTTLLRMIAGLEKPTSGRLELDGQDLRSLAANERGVALLSQSVSLYPQLSVWKNLESAIKGKSFAGRRLAKSERESRITQMLSGFGIESLADKLPSQLSGGEAQRVAFARALVAEPKLLLLDEPLSQLDGPNRESAILLLKEVAERFRPTTIMVSHDPVDAMRLGDQVAVLNAGLLLDSGSPESVYRNPSCRASANMFGVWGMNWLEADQVSWPNASPTDPRRWIGFRPEAAEVVNTETQTSFDARGSQGQSGSMILGEASMQLCGRVESCAFVGSGYLCEMFVADGKIRFLANESLKLTTSETSSTDSNRANDSFVTLKIPKSDLCWADD